MLFELSRNHCVRVAFPCSGPRQRICRTFGVVVAVMLGVHKTKQQNKDQKHAHIQDFGQGGPAEFWPQGGALSPKYAQNRGFSLKIAWKLHDFEEILGASWVRHCKSTICQVIWKTWCALLGTNVILPPVACERDMTCEVRHYEVRTAVLDVTRPKH